MKEKDLDLLFVRNVVEIEPTNYVRSLEKAYKISCMPDCRQKLGPATV